MSDDNKCSFRYLHFDKDWSVMFKINALLELNRYSNYGSFIGVGAGQVGPVLTGPLFRKKLVGVTIIAINTCVLVRAAAACSASG